MSDDSRVVSEGATPERVRAVGRRGYNINECSLEKRSVSVPPVRPRPRERWLSRPRTRWRVFVEQPSHPRSSQMACSLSLAGRGLRDSLYTALQRRRRSPLCQPPTTAHAPLVLSFRGRLPQQRGEICCTPAAGAPNQPLKILLALRSIRVC